MLFSGYMAAYGRKVSRRAARPEARGRTVRARGRKRRAPHENVAEMSIVGATEYRHIQPSGRQCRFFFFFSCVHVVAYNAAVDAARKQRRQYSSNVPAHACSCMPPAYQVLSPVSKRFQTRMRDMREWEWWLEHHLAIRGTRSARYGRIYLSPRSFLNHGVDHCLPPPGGGECRGGMVSHRGTLSGSVCVWAGSREENKSTGVVVVKVI